LSAACLLVGGLAGAADSDRSTRPGALRSLAGQSPVEKPTPPDQLHPDKDQDLIRRDFVQQPPLIPHSTRGYQITKNFNQCMDCHSWARYKETGATKVSITHFKDRAGDELSNISPRRYFCNQCHVPQKDVKPLVTNTFRSGKGLR
jgi:cytochrome c-type protein NapB